LGFSLQFGECSAQGRRRRSDIRDGRPVVRRGGDVQVCARGIGVVDASYIDGRCGRVVEGDRERIAAKQVDAVEARVVSKLTDLGQ
jgi:hypothetical protein